jgi:hypothetical protein
VLTAATIKIARHSPIDTDRCFIGMYYLHLQGEVHTDDEGSVFHRKFGEFLRVNTSHLTTSSDKNLNSHFHCTNASHSSTTCYSRNMGKEHVFQIKPALLLQLIATTQGCARKTPIIAIVIVHENCLQTFQLISVRFAHS